MHSSALLHEWQLQPEDYERVFRTPEGYIDAFRAIMRRYGTGMDKTCWFDWSTGAPDEEEDFSIRDWIRTTVQAVEPTHAQLTHFVIYAADLMFMSGHLREAWDKFVEVPVEYVMEAFRGLNVGSGDEVMETVRTAHQLGIPADYIRDYPGGLRDYTYIPEDLSFFSAMAVAGVPPQFARAIRYHGPMSRMSEWNIEAWESGVPAEYIASLKGVELEYIKAGWATGLPAEYTRALQPAYSNTEEA